MKNIIEKNSTILFQGDSVTDCGRLESSNGLGFGYANMIAAWLTAQYPQKSFNFLNKGISGNRVIDLQNRWKEDCLDLNPSIVSILIGINDCWRKYDNNDATAADKFEATYKQLLTEVKEKTNAKIIIMEPFLLPVIEERSDWSAGQSQWREDLDPKIHVARKLAREFEATFIPLDGIFAKASMALAMDKWAGDGVHPSQAGHALIAQEWIKAVTQ
ncbi:SGNH/GDSL hydrolase family protein [Clostridium grantii]|uniref:Lysophospholipase L1 n=1 Tax=Clostridium grantii DSM 8605 TaxID=1121316 RepID=A0A1M5TQ44_9CLOT|nr:SGNH/GDSL hydrolase family protein [Clostridium grantii]SHH52513.1 Lysophospholipase L1 [Clostridium grantii DSM 8605]